MKRYIFRLIKDVVKIPLEMITFNIILKQDIDLEKNVTAFYISIEE